MMDRNSVSTLVTDAIDQLRQHLSITSVYGAPVTSGEVTVIPVASVVLGFGFGGGYGGPAGAAMPGTAAEGAGDQVSGAGGGGGAGGRAAPRGYIEIGPNRVRYVPIMDQTLVALAGICMVAWNIFWITLTIRSIAARRRKD